MKKLLIVGSLGYHDATISEPIYEQAKFHFQNVHWAQPVDANGALVHVEAFTDATLKMWGDFSRHLSFDTLIKDILRDGDVVLFLDFWNPSIFQFKFWATRNNKDLKFYTIHHGSSHLAGDFANMPAYRWVDKFEDAWAACYDGIFLASSYVSNLLGSEFGKTHVTYLPIDYLRPYMNKYLGKTGFKNGKVIMPLRMDSDKGVDRFLEFVNNNPKMELIAFSDTPENFAKFDNLDIRKPMERADLFKLESECSYVISFARQETFGYAVLEAVMMGCKPIIYFDENVNPELYPEFSFIYDTTQLTSFSQFYRFTEQDVFRLLDKVDGATEKMCLIMSEQR